MKTARGTQLIHDWLAMAANPLYHQRNLVGNLWQHKMYSKSVVVDQAHLNEWFNRQRG
jgi:hypothetical protein